MCFMNQDGTLCILLLANMICINCTGLDGETMSQCEVPVQVLVSQLLQEVSVHTGKPLAFVASTDGTQVLYNEDAEDGKDGAEDKALEEYTCVTDNLAQHPGQPLELLCTIATRFTLQLTNGNGCHSFQTAW